MPGAGLTATAYGQARPDRLALKPYWGKPAVRNFRGGDGNVGIIRRPVRAIALPDCTDWDTTENVRLAPPRLDKLRLGGVPFTAKDWTRIEAAPGELQPAVRATAWVCNDRRPPVINWQPADAASKPE